MFENLLPYLPTTLLVVILSGYLIFLLKNRNDLAKKRNFNEIFYKSCVYGFLSYGLVFLLYISTQKDRFTLFPLDFVLLEISAMTFLISILLITTETIYEKVCKFAEQINNWINSTFLEKINELTANEHVDKVLKMGIWFQIIISLIIVLAIPVLSPFQSPANVSAYGLIGDENLSLFIQNKADYARVVSNFEIVCFDSNNQQVLVECPSFVEINSKLISTLICRGKKITRCDVNLSIDGYPITVSN